jgi:hypothetical protein
VSKIFLSYNSHDHDWAIWIGVTLRDHGHQPFVYEWEIGAGQNIPRWMDERMAEAEHLIGVFSDAYAKALYSSAERWAAYWQDPAGRDGYLIPVEVETVTDWPPLVRPLNRLSLVGRSEAEAETALLAFLIPPHPPEVRPPFPGKALPDKSLPGWARPGRDSVEPNGDQRPGAERPIERESDRPSAPDFLEHSKALPARRPPLPARGRA